MQRYRGLKKQSAVESEDGAGRNPSPSLVRIWISCRLDGRLTETARGAWYLGCCDVTDERQRNHRHIQRHRIEGRDQVRGRYKNHICEGGDHRKDIEQKKGPSPPRQDGSSGDGDLQQPYHRKQSNIQVRCGHPCPFVCVVEQQFWHKTLPEPNQCDGHACSSVNG
jgi:hypothetical protein